MSDTNDTTNQLSRRTKDQLIVDLVEVRAELDMLRRVSDDLRQSAARYPELFEQSPIGIWEEDFSGARVKIEDWRRDGVRDFRMFFSDHPDMLRAAVKSIRLLDVNQAAVEIYGLAGREEFLRSAPDPTGLPGWETIYEAVLVAFAEGKDRLAIEHEAKTADGRDLVVRSISHLGEPYRDSWARVVTSVEDVTERWTADRRIAHRANHDSLTDLPNRNLFLDRLEQAIVQSGRYGRQFALHVVDLDHFKQVNDTLGHPVGDELLKAVAVGLTRNIRAADTVARLGGDEFAVIQCELDRADTDAAQLARRMLGALSRPFRLGPHEVRIGATIGIALYPENATDIADLQRNADLALYAGKAKGRNTYMLFEPGLATR